MGNCESGQCEIADGKVSEGIDDAMLVDTDALMAPGSFDRGSSDSPFMREERSLSTDRETNKRLTVTKRSRPAVALRRKSVKAAPATKSQQCSRIASQDGFVAVVSQTPFNSTLEAYGVNVSSSEEADTQMRARVSRIASNEHFQGTHVMGAFTHESILEQDVNGKALGVYLWEDKRIVPMVSLDVQVLEEKHGVEILDLTNIEDGIYRCAHLGVYGAKAKAVIRSPNIHGIRALLDQQLEIANLIMSNDMVAILHPEVDIHAEEKAKCEQILLQELLKALDLIESQVMLVLTLPNKPNNYYALCRHPSVARVMALSGGYGQEDACKMLSQNIAFVACFGRAFIEGAHVDQPEEEFSTLIHQACNALLDCSKTVSALEEMKVKLSTQDGFLVAVDQSAADTKEALERFGIASEGLSDADAREKMEELLKRLISNEDFKGSKVIGTIVHEHNLGVTIEGNTLADHLWQAKNVVPILNVDAGLQSESKGVQLMGDIPKLDELLADAIENGIFVLKTRSLVRASNLDGIQELVKQQFEFSKRLLEKGMIPFLQLEVDDSMRPAEKIICERMLFDVLIEALGNLKPSDQIMLDLTVPAEPNTYLPLIRHPNTIRVTAHSGGKGQKEACRLLAQNFDLIASFGHAFTEDLKASLTDDEFMEVLRNTCDAIFEASTIVPAKEVQSSKVQNMDGFFAALDQGGKSVLQKYGAAVDNLDEQELQTQLTKMRKRILSDPALNGSRVLAMAISEDFMDVEIEGLPSPEYLWKVKDIVPFVKVDKGLQAERNGVQLAKLPAQLDRLLDKAVSRQLFGAKARCAIRLPNTAAIKAAVEQQMSLAKTACAKDLVPVLLFEVDINSPQKAECEMILCKELLAGLDSLRQTEKVVLWMTLPTVPNRYTSLCGHPCLIRLVGLSGGLEHAEACRQLSNNVGMIAGFGRAIVEGLKEELDDEMFTKVLDDSISKVFEVSKSRSSKFEQMIKMTDQEGLIATFDQEGDSLREQLSNYGIDCSDNEQQMRNEAHDMRSRVITNHRFNGSRIIAVVLPEDSMAREMGRMLTAKYLWEVKRIVPLLKIDRGRLPEKDGVQLLRGADKLSAAMDKAIAFGCLGVKFRSIIRLPSAVGIKAAVEQQVEVAKQCLAKGLLPVLHLEVTTESPDKAGCERILRQALMAGLRQFGTKDKVLLELSIPETADNYRPLLQHKRAARVAFLSGGCGLQEACKKLTQNPGVIAAFGRALLEGLSVKQTDTQFTKKMEKSVKAVLTASCQPVPDEANVAEKGESKSKVGKRKEHIDPLLGA
eukprot:TRINITY_DN29739_c0_g1_i1.p1 TRINITY_DN29739_c0_g1~~TRINITY_DN29739_c0_g1_i1.p1  ORF type:complete len:1305 (+),score=285.02 TRINITY_DN29739_c0_g1_i1:47-3916(+)